MILLSAQLEALGTYIPDVIRSSSPSAAVLSDEDVGFHTALESQSPSNSPRKGQSGVLTINGVVPLTLTTPPILRGNSNKKKYTHPKGKAKITPPARRSLFASKTTFEALAALEIEDEDEVEDEEDQEALGTSIDFNSSAKPFSAPAQQVKKAKVSHVTAVGTQDPGTSATRAHKQNTGPEALMPPFNSDFWRVYANRLRVFGTKERFLELDPLRKL
jgi:poly(A)-specific ribonuclease